MFQKPEVSVVGFDYLGSTELAQLQRNLSFLYSTAAGTCPGDRNFGLDQSFESYPVNVAQNLFVLEVVEKTEIYENRAEVLDVTFEQAEDGNLTPQILIGEKEPEDAEEEMEG